jgi:hypothetical protein
MTKPDQKPVVHVVFSMSGAGSLRRALEQVGCNERVIGQPDDFSFGPINEEGNFARLAWAQDELAYDSYWDVLEFDNLFWGEATSANVHPVVWVNRRCAKEYAGFLQFLSQVPHSGFKIVDITGVIFSNGKGTFVAHSIGEIAPEQIAEARLVERQAHLSTAEIESYRTAWRKLRAENAPLRVISADGLVSAPITYFDDVISSFVRENWTKCARVIGEVLTDQACSPFWQAGDLLLYARLRKLAEAGVFEYQGDLSSMRHSEVRRALKSENQLD